MLYDNIMIPYDGSASSKAALAEAVRFAKDDPGLTLRIVQIIDTDQLAIDKLEKEWKQYPVFHLSFGGQNFVEPYALDKVLEEFVAMAELLYGKDEFAKTLSSRSRAVLKKAHAKTGLR